MKDLSTLGKAPAIENSLCITMENVHFKQKPFFALYNHGFDGRKFNFHIFI